MKRVLSALLPLLVACVLTSCVEDMNKTDLEKSIRKHATETINNVWYVGSAESYDYFVHNTATQSRKIRLKENEIYLSARFPLTGDEKKWQLVKGDADLNLKGNPIQSLDEQSGFQIDSASSGDTQR